MGFHASANALEMALAAKLLGKNDGLSEFNF